MIISETHEIVEYIRSKKPVLKIIASEHKRIHPELMETIRKEGIPLLRLSEMAFRKKYASSRGLVAIIESVETKDLDQLLEQLDYSVQNRILLVDEVNDPQNVGAMLRSCVCFGFHAAILTDRNTAPISDGVVNSSSGSCFHIPLCRVTNLSKCIEVLQKKGFWIVGTTPDKGQWLDKIDTERHLAIVMGNEEKGIRPKVLEYCDYRVQIPMKAGFDSLNVSVAFGVIAFSLFNEKL
jgi:23S rRNA (guanosine2251-2'-O)-methyltransferase